MQSLETKSSRPRPKSFETETRPETFETETEKPENGSGDRDQVSRLHHWKNHSVAIEVNETTWYCFANVAFSGKFAFSYVSTSDESRIIFLPERPSICQYTVSKF